MKVLTCGFNSAQARTSYWKVVELSAYLLLVGVYIVTRYTEIFYLQVPRYFLDFVTYYIPAHELGNGVVPDFTVRAPGFPVFFAAIQGVFGSHSAVVIAQSLLRFAAFLYFTYSAFRLHRTFGLLVAFAVLVALGRSAGVSFENLLLSDVLYSAELLFFFAFVLRAMRTAQARHFAAASASAGLLILTRPNGIWTIVLLAVVTALSVAIRNLAVRRVVVPSLLPVSALVAALVLYNGLTRDVWKPSAIGDAALAGATWFYWEPSPTYTEGVNRLIETLQVNSADCDRRPVLCHAYRDVPNLKNIYDIRSNSILYARLYGFWSKLWVNGLSDYYFANYPRVEPLTELAPLLQTLSINAIRSHPDIYASTVLVSLFILDYQTAREASQPLSAIARQRRLDISRSRQAFADTAKTMEMSPGTVSTRRHLEYRRSEYMGEFTHRIPAEVLRRLQAVERGDYPLLGHLSEWYHTWLHGPLFGYGVVGILYLAVLVAATATLVAYRGRHFGAATAFVLCIGALGSSLIVALSSLGLARYGEPDIPIQLAAIAGFVLLGKQRSLD